MRWSPKSHISLTSRYSSSRAHLRWRNSTMASRPTMNSPRLRHRLVSEYPCATRFGSHKFQAFSASRTFSMAVSRVNGGRGGRGLLMRSVLKIDFDVSQRLQATGYADRESLGRRRDTVAIIATRDRPRRDLHRRLLVKNTHRWPDASPSAAPFLAAGMHRP